LTGVLSYFVILSLAEVGKRKTVAQQKGPGQKNLTPFFCKGKRKVEEFRPDLSAKFTKELTVAVGQEIGIPPEWNLVTENARSGAKGIRDWNVGRNCVSSTSVFTSR